MNPYYAHLLAQLIAAFLVGSFILMMICTLRSSAKREHAVRIAFLNRFPLATGIPDLEENDIERDRRTG